MHAPLRILHSVPDADRAQLMRAVTRVIGFVLAALLAYAVWRGYQNPDFVLDLAAFRLC